jgi:hypothetical protein
MKKSSLIILAILLLVGCNQNKQEQKLKSDFQNIVQQHQPRTWWRWLGGNISKEGITKDLEEIKEKGMKGVTLFNLGAYYPQGDVTFMTDEWLDLFDFAVDECERLGLDFSFQMCDGWGASGGPWVDKENAMKVLTSEKTTIEGGNSILMELPVPFHRLNFYQDIKVFAFPAIDTTEHRFNAENVSVNFNGWSVNPEYLIDGSRYTVTNFGFQPGEEQAIYFELIQPRSVSEINLHHGDRETPVNPKV